MLEFEVNDEGLRKLTEHTMEVFRKALKHVATDLYGNLAREAPVDQGRLAGSFRLEQLEPLAHRISSEVHYAMYPQTGTGIYGPVGRPIVPVRAKVLAFEWQGRMWFLKSVKGQEPNPYIDRAMERTENRTQEFVDRALREVGQVG